MIETVCLCSRERVGLITGQKPTSREKGLWKGRVLSAAKRKAGRISGQLSANACAMKRGRLLPYLGVIPSDWQDALDEWRDMEGMPGSDFDPAREPRASTPPYVVS